MNWPQVAFVSALIGIAAPGLANLLFEHDRKLRSKMSHVFMIFFLVIFWKLFLL